MCRNVNELCQIVVTEHSLEMIHLGISAVIVMKVKIAKQYKVTVGICKLCEKLSRNSVAGAIKLNSLQRLNGQATTGEVDKTDRTVIGKCIHLYDETLGNKETPALSTENCLCQVQKKKKAKKKTDKKNLIWIFCCC